MFKKYFIRGLILILAITTVCGILFWAFVSSYRTTENRNFAELRKKAELDCMTMPYHCAIKEGDAEKISVLKTSGANINSLDRFGNTPLLYAITWNASVIDQLLELGADPNIPNEQGLTPLEHSLNLNDFPLAEKLIRHGADPNAKAEGDKKKYLTLLTDFIIQKNEPATTFLVQHGANLTQKDGYGYDACERVHMYGTASIFSFCERR